MASQSARFIGRPRQGLGIQSKLLIVLLLVSVVSVLVAGSIGYVSGTESRRSAEFKRMTQLRESRAREITNYFGTVSNAAASIVTHGEHHSERGPRFQCGFRGAPGNPTRT